MSGYVFKTSEESVECRVNWREGYLERDEYVDGDLGWSVAPAPGRGDAVIKTQRFDEGTSLARIVDGVPGKIYMVSARARTNLGRALERAIVLRIAA